MKDCPKPMTYEQRREATRAAVKALHCMLCFDVLNNAPRQNPCGCRCHR